MAGDREKIERVWTPAGWTPRERRNERVKVVGSLLIIACVLAACAVAWL
jgi:hypothetical protein